MPFDTARGFRVRQVASRYRVGKDTVLTWIRKGELAAVNTASVRCGKPRYVILPEALAEFERGRAAVTPEKPVRRRKQMAPVDYYPD
jgi:excisionase family DNA binding protein